MSGSGPEYERALKALGTLISGRQRADGRNWSHAFELMQVHLERLGLEQQLPKLSVIHVAGTKGKGSTCSMVESILRSCGYKTGLFTSPHLIDVRERVRINGVPVAEDVFLRNLWRCFNTLKEKADEEVGMPAYFRFLTLLGLEIFLEQEVDVVILEVGLGGRLDATNCVRSPVVCGISSLGFDHMELLGNTLEEIAGEKAGILKAGAPAFTAPQPENALQVLHQRAAAVGAPLQVVKSFDTYRAADGLAVQLGLAGDHQKLNAALAISLASTWEAKSAVAAAKGGGAAAQHATDVAQGILPAEYKIGLENARWPGRSQVIHDDASPSHQALGDLPRLSFYLDGAHTAESMASCAQWFSDAAGQAAGAAAAGRLVTKRVLLFNCMQEREPANLLQPLAETLASRCVAIDQTLFVPPDSAYSSLDKNAAPDDLAWQHSLRAVWEKSNHAARLVEGGATSSIALPTATSIPGLLVQGGARGAVLPNLQVTLEWLRRCVRDVPSLHMQVLVTGSLYLVGDMLRVLGRGSS